MTYGGTVPTVTPGYSGFVNGDSASSLTTTPTCSTTATSSDPPSPPTYASSCSGASDPNYTIVYDPGATTVTAGTHSGGRQREPGERGSADLRRHRLAAAAYGRDRRYDGSDLQPGPALDEHQRRLVVRQLHVAGRVLQRRHV